MDWNVKTEITQEEVDRYTAIVSDYIEQKRGWKPGEYRMRFIAALADAPLAAFNVIHYDGVRELNQAAPTKQGSHPLEMQVYVQIKEMRAFTSYEEFQQILRESQKEKEDQKSN